MVMAAALRALAGALAAVSLLVRLLDLALDPSLAGIVQVYRDLAGALGVVVFGWWLDPALAGHLTDAMIVSGALIWANLSAARIFPEFARPSGRAAAVFAFPFVYVGLATMFMLATLSSPREALIDRGFLLSFLAPLFLLAALLIGNAVAAQ